MQSANLLRVESAAADAVAAICRAIRARGGQVIDLTADEPDFRTPAFAGEAGRAAIDQGFTRYSPVAGVPELRAAIAGHLGRIAGRSLSPEGIVVSTGATQALFNACFSLFGPGDDVLIPVPFWTAYPELVRLARARAIPVPPADDAGRRITVADLELALTPGTRGLILNSPAHPNGTVYSLAELEALIAWAAARGLTVLCDEVYRDICFGAERAPSVLELDPALLRHVVLIDGTSAGFAMGGWRIGFSWSEPESANAFASLQRHVTSGACTPAQYAALAVYRDEPRVHEAVQAMVRVFRRRRDAAVARIAERAPHLSAARPEGAFFLFLRVDACYHADVQDSAAFCHWLLERTGVALLPGSAFGDDRYVRLSFASPEAEILEGIDRIGRVTAGVHVPA